MLKFAAAKVTAFKRSSKQYMELKQRIKAFDYLGKFISQFTGSKPVKIEGIPNNDLFYEGMLHQIKIAKEHNGWFSQDNIRFALKGWEELLTTTNLEKWVSKYDLTSIGSKRIAIIMAGNIPLVGFHDFLTVLICGHKVLVKQSSNDKQLLPYLTKFLEYSEPEFIGAIRFTEEKLINFDAVIATGSNNTARYFEYYFKDKPSIIRKNRNSIAILTGKESETQLNNLSEDIFRYYGLGCRNVSKLYVPKDYNFDAFFKGIYHWHPIIEEHKYANNYDYNKAVYIMSEFDMLENGFLMIKEDDSFGSPIATLFYEFYQNETELQNILRDQAEHIQCIVSDGFSSDEIPFGESQRPQLWDYADGIDTVEFLLKNTA